MIKVNNDPKKRFFYYKVDENELNFINFKKELEKYIEKKEYDKLKIMNDTMDISRSFSCFIFYNKIQDVIGEIENNLIKETLNSLDWFKVLVGSIEEIKELIEENKDILSILNPDEVGFNNYKNAFSNLYTTELSGKMEFKKRFFDTLDLNVCPYCNRNFINPINKDEINQVFDANNNKSPDIEHFYPKSKYPFLSLSISNLLPSCAFCNSIKSNVDTFNENCISPYDIKIKDIKFDFNLGVNKIDEIKIKSDNNNSKVLNLEEFYNSIHKNYINESYTNILKHPNAYKEYMTREYNMEEERYEKIFRNYFDEDDFNKQPLSKLTKEFYEFIKKYDE